MIFFVPIILHSKLSFDSIFSLLDKKANICWNFMYYLGQERIIMLFSQLILIYLQSKVHTTEIPKQPKFIGDCNAWGLKCFETDLN